MDVICKHTLVWRLQAPQAGEIVKFMIADGAPVEYKEEVVEMAPFFGGQTIDR